MSFILDALKKSETDRQRQSGPALFEVKVAPPRTRLPPWAIAIAALLVVNLGIVIWMVLRHATASATPSNVTSDAPVPATVLAGAATTAPAPGSTAATPPGSLPAAVPPPPVTAQTASMPPAAAPPAAVAAVPPPSAPAAAVTAGNGSSNPDDYAPAQEGSPGGQGAPPGGHVRRGTAAGVPLYQDVSGTAGAQLPQLRLDLHVYAARPQDRFVMINMHKLREGDSLPEGVHVESITPEGAVLSYNGSRFLLTRE